MRGATPFAYCFSFWSWLKEGPTVCLTPSFLFGCTSDLLPNDLLYGTPEIKVQVCSEQRISVRFPKLSCAPPPPIINVTVSPKTKTRNLRKESRIVKKKRNIGPQKRHKFEHWSTLWPVSQCGSCRCSYMCSKLQVASILSLFLSLDSPLGA
jgi:hypothetical protein